MWEEEEEDGLSPCPILYYKPNKIYLSIAIYLFNEMLSIQVDSNYLICSTVRPPAIMKFIIAMIAYDRVCKEKSFCSFSFNIIFHFKRIKAAAADHSLPL